MTLECDATNHKCSFLVDTQADISVLKYDALIENTEIDSSEKINIKGVTDGSIASLGTILANLTFPNLIVQHRFHIVPNTFNIPSEGILGKDFVKRLQCKIDYANMTLTLRVNNMRCSVPLKESPMAGTIVLPARSEVIREFHIEGFKFPQVIESREIQPGIFIARTISDSATPLIRVLNTTNESKVISNAIRDTENLSDFNVYTLDRSEQNQSAFDIRRTNELLQIIGKNIPEYSRDTLLPLCAKYADVFALDNDRMTVNNFYEQALRVTDNEPVYVKNYRLPKSQKPEIESQVNKLLRNNLIEPSMSNYNSPLILVPKKSVDGQRKWRMCVDYRMVNKKLIADKYPLPRIDDILDSLGRAKHFSVLDLYSGFHQIGIEEGSRDITSFSTDKGSFRWKVLPFGLNVSPNSFARMMALAFAGLPPDSAFLYMDDIIVIGCSESHHLANLEQVFLVCRKRNLKLNPLKCEFLKPEVNFLGHRCTSNGMLPDQSKIEVIKRYPRPSDKDATRRLVAFANYYRRFIRNFADIVRPLNQITRKNVDFKWSQECELSFQTLKARLSSPPILQYPDFGKPFLVTVDASNMACGAVLSQNFDGHDLPIFFASKAFNRAEQNKSTIEKELIAIHFAVNHFRPYLYGTNFTVRSDHRPLIFLYKLKNPSSKLTRIRLDLEEYNFTVEYVKGTQNVVADALSRITIEELKKLYPPCTSVLHMTTRSMSRNMNQKQLLNETNKHANYNMVDLSTVKVVEELGSSFLKAVPRIRCRNLKLLLENHANNEFRAKMKLSTYMGHRKIFDLNLNTAVVNEKLDLDAVLSKLQQIANDLNIKKIQWPLTDEIFLLFTVNEFKNVCERQLTDLRISLITSPIRVENEEERIQLITRLHTDPILGGHCGQKRLYARLRRHYYWKGMTRDVARFVKSCEICRLSKVKPSNKEPMILTETPQRPFDVVVIDTIGPLKRSYQGNLYAVTIICQLSKYVVAAPVANKEAKTVARAIFEHFILIYGPMKQILTDLGSEYKNEVMSELCKLLKIEHRFSTAYRHETLGTIERNHRVFNEYVRAYISENMEQWEEFLKYFVFSYNTTNNSSLDHKYTPYELVFNKNVNMPYDLFSDRIDPVYNVESFAKEARFRLQTAHQEAQKLVQKSKEKNKEFYDKTAKPSHLTIGDKVLLEREPYNKHKPIYVGPLIVNKTTESNVELVDPITNKVSTVHKNRVRKLIE